MFYKERKEKKTVWVYLYRIQLINVDICHGDMMGLGEACYMYMYM